MRKINGKLTAELLKYTDPKNVGKNNAYPISNFRLLVEQVAKLSYLNKDFLLFFRGQKNDYKNKAGFSSFYPSIYRGDYLLPSDVNRKFEILNNCCKILAELFKKNKIDGFTELSRKKLIQWSILQHYEVADTPLIDITQSLRVACSFAQLDNDENNAYVYVFGLPYFSNRISYNSEHDLVNVRLLSITPPNALRPYFQEGYLVGTEDITNEYQSKDELDLNNRLIAKFEIPNTKTFWGREFNRIPRSALYPRKDTIEKICREIRQQSERTISSTLYGEFLLLWSEMEQILINRAKQYIRDVHQLRIALNVLMKYEPKNKGLLLEFDYLRAFRNRLVHGSSDIDNAQIGKSLEILRQFKKNYK